MLNGTEITSTQYICDTSAFSNPYVGDLVITNASELAAAQQYTAVIGSLYIQVSDAKVSLSQLAYVQGTVSTCGDAGDLPLTTLEAPELLRFGGWLDLSCNPQLASLSMPKLQSAGNLWIGPSALTSLALPSLTALTEPMGSPLFAVSDNPQLNDCDAYRVLNQLPKSGLSIYNQFSGNIECKDGQLLCPTVGVGADASFRFCNKVVSDYGDARLLCKSIGTGWDTLYFTSDAERRTCATELPGLGDTWLGYTDIKNEGTFVWEQTTTPAYAPQDTGNATAWQSLARANDSNTNCATFRPNGGEEKFTHANCVSSDPFAVACRMLP